LPAGTFFVTTAPAPVFAPRRPRRARRASCRRPGTRSPTGSGSWRCRPSSR
jgi:hypothetical protein